MGRFQPEKTAPLVAVNSFRKLYPNHAPRDINFSGLKRIQDSVFSGKFYFQAPVVKVLGGLLKILVVIDQKIVGS